jgi:hypothetical protein
MASSAGVISAQVALLVEGVVQSMQVSRIKITLAVFLTVGILATGAGLSLSVGESPSSPRPGATTKSLTPPGGEAAPAPGGDSTEVKKLLKERLEALRNAVLALQEEYKAGRGTAELFIETARPLLEAELELATKPAERIAAHQAYFKLLVMVDEIVKARYEAGQVRVAEFYLARAARLKAEIELRRAGGKPDKDIKPASPPKPLEK